MANKRGDAERSANSNRETADALTALQQELQTAKAKMQSIIEEKDAVNQALVDANAKLQELNATLYLKNSALLQSKERFRGLVEASFDGIWEIDENAQFTYVSPRLSQILGYAPEEILGKVPFQFMEPKEAERVLKHIRDPAVAEKPFMAVENIYIRKNGKPVIFETSGVPITDRNGKFLGMRGVHRDITERKKAEAALAETQEQLRQSEKMQAVGQLAGGIAHDFNNQLAAILGYADLLRVDLETNPTLTRYTDNIITGINRASDLTAQLLAFSRKGKYLSSPVDLHEIISEVINLLHHSIDKKIVIKQRLEAHPSITLGDPTQLQNAVLNLTLNARDAMEDGGHLEIATQTVELEKPPPGGVHNTITPGTYIEVRVQDTGAGMTPSTIPRIFEPFYTTKAKGTGTGMGLASVYGTVISHQGTIHVESTKGEGSTFRMYLPLQEVESIYPPPPCDSIPSPADELRILLVEDEAMLCDVAVEMLEQLGHQATSCANGEEAVNLYRKEWNTIDVVILDLVMPKMGGKEAFIAMKEINPNITALIASGYSLEGEAQSILEEGAAGFIQKPFRISDLAAKIAKVFKSR